MMPARYITKIADGILARALTTSGAIQVKGPKWCDETATSLQQAAGVVYLQDPGHSASYLALIGTRPSTLLEGRTSRLIDEWQTAPRLWDVIHFAVDPRGEPGQLVLTDSSTPATGGAHPGAGRITPMVVRTMALFRSEDSGGQISLRRLSDEEEGAVDIALLDTEDTVRVLCRGGWPTAITTGVTSVPGRLTRTYIEGLIDSDVACMDGISRSSARIYTLTCAYAHHVPIQASQTTIATDLTVNDGATTPNMISDYLNALSCAYVMEDLPAWGPVPHSKTAICTSLTHYFANLLIGVAVMRWTPADLPRGFETFGLQFESLCMHNLQVCARAVDGTLLHYQDKTGLEADAVIVLAGRRWASIEVEFSSRQLDEAVTHLRPLRERVDMNRVGEPSLLIVVIAGITAHRHGDGILVVPLTCLRS